MTSVHKYLFQAMDNYPYSLEDTLESLDYALSYDENNTMALCLYGRMLSEQLQRYEEAKTYFQKALTIDVNAVEVYPYYIETLLYNEDFEEAGALIDFALKVKGISKIDIKWREVQLYEMKMELDEALSLAEKLKLYVFDSSWNKTIKETTRRLKKKIAILDGKVEE
ncbi:tetratricopeptide repeat protein [Sinomicrobium sp.]